MKPMKQKRFYKDKINNKIKAFKGELKQKIFFLRTYFMDSQFPSNIKIELESNFSLICRFLNIFYIKSRHQKSKCSKSVIIKKINLKLFIHNIEHKPNYCCCCIFYSIISKQFCSTFFRKLLEIFNI